MAKDEKSSAKKSRRDRNRDKAKPPTKNLKKKYSFQIVIRHLPPTMTEEEFLKQIDPLPEHDFYYFAAADWSLGFDATCRAYITLKNYEDVFLFRDRFDGYVFVDNKGNEYAAIVEFAPFQGFLKNKSRNSDSKVNTIEQELHYQQFLKKLEEDREAAAKGGESKLEFSLDSKKEEITSTPLLQYLASKKEKRREESKKRTAEKKKRREEEKEKRKQVTPAPSQPLKVLTSDNASKVPEKTTDQKPAQNREEPKNARARRREERNRLRHEAYLQKKKAQKEMQSNNKDNDGVAATTSSTAEKEDASQGKKMEEGKSQQESEPKPSPSTSSSAEPNKPIEILKKSKAVDMLTESVRNFIITAATTLTVPPGGSSAGDENEKSKDDIDKSLESASNKSDVSQVKAATGELDNESKEFLASLTEKQREERREERRIRNKDRPSIAIYQPKPRLRLSEESDSNSTSKDVRSLSQSDCENGKKDEPPRHKKVQRYSERSKNRRKSTTKDAGSEDDHPTNA
ncbi:regulator of nonsense transcripts 3B [Musca vetustissima]|uniref:regulator of nonsense transcripts 3B n=1 Tax=Musca vetustissima TaxID=27455 RepID=UPI002AB74C24|nr:regulator of nonsense transcripts 3B [Musca vetustissima]